MSFRQYAGRVICANGTKDATCRLKRVLWNDLATGVMRQADVGYQDAKDCARENGLSLLRILGTE